MDSSVISWVVASVCVVLNLIVSTAITVLVKRWFDKRDQKEKENAANAARVRAFEQERDKQQLREAMSAQCQVQISNFRQELAPVITQLKNIENGTLSGLRSDILSCYYSCATKGWRNDWDYKTMHELFEAYTQLGGNSFIADVVKRFDQLPIKDVPQMDHN